MTNQVQAFFFPLAVLLLLLLAASSSTSNASVLEDTCKSFAANHTDIGYDYCVQFLQVDKGSATADKRGLAAIAARITGEAARSNGDRVAALKAIAKDKRVVECLSDCAQAYSSSVNQTGQAARGIASGSAGDLRSAVTALGAALNASATCGQGFRDLNVSSPLAMEDAAFGRVATIAMAVTSALLKSA